MSCMMQHMHGYTLRLLRPYFNVYIFSTDSLTFWTDNVKGHGNIYSLPGITGWCRCGSLLYNNPISTVSSVILLAQFFFEARNKILIMTHSTVVAKGYDFLSFPGFTKKFKKIGQRRGACFRVELNTWWARAVNAGVNDRVKFKKKNVTCTFSFYRVFLSPV